MSTADRLKKVIVNGAELHYLEQGQGQPLVFVHGSLGDYRSWFFQMEPFAERYRVIAYSRRYHYPNAWSDDGLDYSAALHADDLAALIGTLGLAPAHVVAASYGGYISLLLAVKYPHLVRALVLGEPPIMPWLSHIPGGAALLEDFLTKAWRPAGAAFERGEMEAGARLFINGVSGSQMFERFSPAGRSRLLDNAAALKAETQARDYFPTLTCEDVALIRSPSLLLNGEHSPRMFHLITDELGRCMPNTQRALIPDATHGMNAGNPEAYNRTVLGFLADVS
jgi:pimeloyl-ACP methyl ester carboxylesterase